MTLPTPKANNVAGTATTVEELFASATQAANGDLVASAARDANTILQVLNDNMTYQQVMGCYIDLAAVALVIRDEAERLSIETGVSVPDREEVMVAAIQLSDLIRVRIK